MRFSPRVLLVFLTIGPLLVAGGWHLTLHVVESYRDEQPLTPIVYIEISVPELSFIGCNFGEDDVVNPFAPVAPSDFAGNRFPHDVEWVIDRVDLESEKDSLP